MSFASPAFLYALFALAIPIIVHLFNFRRFKKVYFTNVRFLKEVKQETQSKSKLKHLLVLISRLLAIAFLVLAFSQPYIPAPEAKAVSGSAVLSVYVDNSFSMEAVNKNGSLLDEAKKRAREIAMAYKPTDRFQLLTNDFEGRHQRLVNREEFLSLVDEVRISPAVKKLSEVFSRQTDLLSTGSTPNRKAFLLSDFQESMADLASVKNDTATEVLLYLTEAQQRSNVYLDSCWFSTPVRQQGKTEQLNIRIRNLSQQAVENNPVKLFINGQQRTPASYSLEPGAQKDIVLSFASKDVGIQQCRVEINDYPVTFDDKFYLSFEVAKRIPVLCIGSAGSSLPSPGLRGINGSLKSVFSDSLFQFAEYDENKLDYSALKNNSLIVLNDLKKISSGLAQELSGFVKNGGSLVVFPGPDADLESYRSFLSATGAAVYERLDTVNTKADKINYEQEIFRDIFEKKDPNIDLPAVYSHYKISRGSRSSEEYILQLQNGDLFLGKYSSGKGKLYLSAVPLDESASNFTRHALFLPALFRIAIYSQPEQRLFYTIGRDEAIETGIANAPAEQVIHLRSAGTPPTDIIPEQRAGSLTTDIFLHGQVTTAGNYYLSRSGQDLKGLSFNYDRLESDLECLNAAAIKDACEKGGLGNFTLLEAGVKGLTDTLSASFHDTKLWKLCILLALAFLAIEVLLLRFMK